MGLKLSASKLDFAIKKSTNFKIMVTDIGKNAIFSANVIFVNQSFSQNENSQKKKSTSTSSANQLMMQFSLDSQNAKEILTIDFQQTPGHPPILVQDDAQVEFFRMEGSKMKKVFGVWFNCHFVDPTKELVVGKSGLDKIFKKKNVPSGFSVFLSQIY